MSLTVRDRPSPHHDPRPPGVEVDTIVLHATVLDSLEETCRHFERLETRAASHYTIDRDGTAVRHVPEDRRAWHAGPSVMPDGRQSVNDFSIGIELVNRNDGEDPYTPAQIASLVELISTIRARHPIGFIVSHAEIAVPPGRKTDPLGLNPSLLGEHETLVVGKFLALGNP